MQHFEFRITEKRRLTLLSLFLLTACFAASACMLKNIPGINTQFDKYEQWKQEQIDQEIKKSADLVNLAATCDKVASVQEFELISRSISTHGAPAVYCYYRSGVPPTVASKNITDFMEREGWHSIENLSINHSFAFQKDDSRVIVQNGGIRDADYGVTCVKKIESAR